MSSTTTIDGVAVTATAAANLEPGTHLFCNEHDEWLRVQSVQPVTLSVAGGPGTDRVRCVLVHPAYTVRRDLHPASVWQVATDGLTPGRTETRLPVFESLMAGLFNGPSRG